MVSSVSIAVMMFPMSVSAFEGSVDATAQVALLNREVSPPGLEACLRLYYLSGESSTTRDLMDNGEFDVNRCITNKGGDCHDDYRNRIINIAQSGYVADDYLVSHCWDKFKEDTDAHKRVNDIVRDLIVDSRKKKSFERVVELLQNLVDADNVDGTGSEDLSGEQEELFLAVKGKMTNLREQSTSAVAAARQDEQEQCTSLVAAARQDEQEQCTSLVAAARQDEQEQCTSLVAAARQDEQDQGGPSTSGRGGSGINSGSDAVSPISCRKYLGSRQCPQINITSGYRQMLERNYAGGRVCLHDQDCKETCCDVVEEKLCGEGPACPPGMQKGDDPARRCQVRFGAIRGSPPQPRPLQEQRDFVSKCCVERQATAASGISGAEAGDES